MRCQFGAQRIRHREEEVMRLSAKGSFTVILALVLAFWAGACSPDDPLTPTQTTVTPPATGAKEVSVEASPQTIPADGITSTLIIANCMVGGEAAPNALPVWFTTDAGDFSTDGVDPIDDAEPTRVTQAITAGGQARIYLISSSDPLTATVNCNFANEASGSVSVNFVRNNSDVGAVALEITPESGTAPLTVEAVATVTSKDDELLSNTPVLFTVKQGTGTVDDRQVKTDSSGTARTFVRGINSDTWIEAVSGFMNATQLVEITNDEDRGIKLEAIDSKGAAITEPVLVNSGGQVLLRATVTSELTGGSPVSGIDVTFSSDAGNVKFANKTVSTDTNGEAETYIERINNTATISASTTNVRDSLTININRAPVAWVELISGSPFAGDVNVLVFSASNSYDPDEAFGDELTYEWSFAIQSTAQNEVNLETDFTNDNKAVTLTVGTVTGGQPRWGDVLTIVLTVTDDSGLTDIDVLTITFN